MRFVSNNHSQSAIHLEFLELLFFETKLDSYENHQSFEALLHRIFAEFLQIFFVLSSPLFHSIKTEQWQVLVCTDFSPLKA